MSSEVNEPVRGSSLSCRIEIQSQDFLPPNLTLFAFPKQ